MALRDARNSLLPISYPYPPKNPYNRSKFAHHFLAFALQAGDFDFVRSYIKSLPATETIISSEVFQRLSAEMLGQLSNALCGYDVSVVYYARDPVARANSLAQQLIKAGKWTYEELSEKPPMLSVRADLTKLAGAFGHDALIVRKFDKSAFVNGDLLADFASVVGVDVPLSCDEKNSSITLETAIRMDEHRRDTGVKGLLSVKDFMVGTTKFSLPDNAIKKIKAHSLDDVIWLYETFGVDLRAADAA
ncbi:hypothetical protein [Poseidonocella sp. HB161398]|uniref:hypothetical protein n=1 Tax=Poseidonocella sp. HB161398 TaxID=2320855 RepID=UPI001108651D|nr:hypothetical protein [Poseidonocella sp. HB161398]